MSDLIKYKRKPDTLSEAMVSTLDTIMKISGKAYTTTFRTISLLKLSPEIQAEIRAGTLPVSQGYHSRSYEVEKLRGYLSADRQAQFLIFLSS